MNDIIMIIIIIIIVLSKDVSHNWYIMFPMFCLWVASSRSTKLRCNSVVSPFLGSRSDDLRILAKTVNENRCICGEYTTVLTTLDNSWPFSVVIDVKRATMRPQENYRRLQLYSKESEKCNIQLCTFTIPSYS